MLRTRGKRKPQNPCATCGLNASLCICALIPKLKLQTKVILIAHYRELRRTTNTGRLAVHALDNSSLFIRGESHERLDLTPLLTQEYDTVFLYPSDDAVELSPSGTSRPVQLLVPDGNWRQASKVHSRHPELAHVPRVKLPARPAGMPTRHIRFEHFEEGMATLEAIAQALGILEGPEVGRQLEALYKAKLEATLKGRAQPLGR